jgi:DIS3-like exonuclease 2
MENTNGAQRKSSGRGRGSGGRKKKTQDESCSPTVQEDQERPTRSVAPGRAPSARGRGGGRGRGKISSQSSTKAVVNEASGNAEQQSNHVNQDKNTPSGDQPTNANQDKSSAKKKPGKISSRSKTNPVADEPSGDAEALANAPSLDQPTNANQDKSSAKKKPRNKKRHNGVKTQTNNNNNKIPFASYWNYSDCLALYAKKQLVRGKLRILPQKDGKAFVTSDRGEFVKDILIETTLQQNRALDGDVVFVELLPQEDEEGIVAVTQDLLNTSISTNDEEKAPVPPTTTWQEDSLQRRLWDPQVAISKLPDGPRQVTPETTIQRKGQVVHVVVPKQLPSELQPADQGFLQRAPHRTIVGRLHRMKRKNGDIFFLQPNNKSLPQFVCPPNVTATKQEEQECLYKAEYVHGSWKEADAKPPCINVQKMGMSCNVEDETQALLVEFDVDHGDFLAPVLKNVDEAVQSGMEMQPNQEFGWRPTPEMYKGRRDFRQERIFTIDPTTAKDLDDALHVKALPDGRVEIGVHIADVSHFVEPGTAVDEEAMRRATTVYLVDRTVPMLPRPLCEIACSLNENVERLAFSCVWRMNMDGSVESPSGKKQDDDVWYGKSVIKSCARLDYATAQNIIDGKVATGEQAHEMDESLWPTSRRPSGKHTVDEVAADVRLMNKVAQARRRLRFQNGALALNGIKLAFQLEEDGETPMLCAPYPIRDSNRLVEEYMLLANYFVAQRLVTHAGGLALLRHHPPPLMDGIEQVVSVAKEGIGFDIDPTSSRSLQASLSRLGRECDDELVMQCVTEMLMTPMKPAEYMAAGSMEPELWRHFALNIPFYTHFTSPIRRYPDVIVHRLLQATLDDDVDAFSMDQAAVQSVSDHCNEKKMASKKAQDRSDRVFLALYLRRKPMKGQLGVVLSVGEKTFSVFVPELGCSVKLFLDEHKDMLTFESYSAKNGERRIRLQRKGSGGWSSIDIKVFTKLSVTCLCKEKPPIDVRLKLEGPWTE